MDEIKRMQRLKQTGPMTDTRKRVVKRLALAEGRQHKTQKKKKFSGKHKRGEELRWKNSG